MHRIVGVSAAATAIVCILMVFGGTVGLSCHKANQNPVIEALNAPSSVDAGTNATLSCSASDPDGDDLTYNWTCTSGSLSSASGASVTWTAPGTSGSSTVNVTVHDGRGGSDARGKSITVSAVTTTIINWDGQVAAHQALYWTNYIQSGFRISGNFSVDNYDITFLILDENNFDNWWNGNSYTYLVKVVQSAGSSFSATIPTTGTYYCVLDNTYSLFTPKFAHLFAQTTSP